MENKRCKYCQCYIMADATVCPHCKGIQENNVKIKKKKSPGQIVLSIFAGIIGFFGFCALLYIWMVFADSSPSEKNNGQHIEQQQTTTPEPKATLGEKNAVRKAKLYLEISGFSYKGIIRQLEFEGYSNDEAVYGAEHCGADWNEQAARKAKSYLDIMAFSKEGLIQQLEFEGFTREQAEYGVKAVGY